jgi:hypothetical protein
LISGMTRAMGLKRLRNLPAIFLRLLLGLLWCEDFSSCFGYFLLGGF